MSEWISVKDRLPIPFERVLLFNINEDRPDRSNTHAGFIDDKQKWLSSTWSSLAIPSDNVTHWQPLPNLPENK